MSQNSFADQLEEVIVRTTGGFFDEAEIWEDMRVTLRVTAGFQRFLEQHDEEPSASELSYMMGTIQSAVDSFFLVGHNCRPFVGLEESWIPDCCWARNFAEVKPRSSVTQQCSSEQNPVRSSG